MADDIFTTESQAVTPTPNATADAPPAEAGQSSVKKADRTPRGVTPPALRLSEAVQLIQKVDDLAGGSASYDLFSQISGNTKTSSTFQRKVSALRQYGVIEDRDNVVSLSDIGNRIVTPREEGDDLNALKEAMSKVDLLNRLYERHRGRLLPEDQFLNGILTQELKVPRELSRSWIDYFRDAVTVAKLTIVRPDGKTQLVEQAPRTPAGPELLVPSSTPPAATPVPAVQAVTHGEDTLPIPLGRGRIAYLGLPSDWSAQRDLSRLLKMIELSLSEGDEETPS